jgi:hypothetical protein
LITNSEKFTSPLGKAGIEAFWAGKIVALHVFSRMKIAGAFDVSRECFRKSDFGAFERLTPAEPAITGTILDGVARQDSKAWLR